MNLLVTLSNNIINFKINFVVWILGVSLSYETKVRLLTAMKKMNKKIKEILEKHRFTPNDFSKQLAEALNSAIIEICEDQKIECSNSCQDEFEAICLLNSKNIAE
jgi:hypothetical protein